MIYVHLEKVERDINKSLENSTCPDITLRHHCSQGNTDPVWTLFNITCRMKNQNLDETKQLIQTVEHSVDCVCSGESIKKKGRSVLKKLCRTKVLLSALAECYQLLSASASKT
ncbi:hypothetical protein NQD34_015160 [Periophthalmus magnuspinnatus]|nr:hypothetical protein NQD34_015160 [Periophthalmus magnuspinnatus]